MLYKLPFVDEFVTEFGNLFVAITIVFVIAVAWRSTNTPDNWQVRAVYVFDRRFRRNRHIPRLTNHTVSATLVESTQPVVEAPAETETEGHITISTQTAQENKSSASGTASNTSQNGQTSNVPDERQEIIETMDADNDIVRQRRLAFFASKSNPASAVSDGASSSTRPSEKVLPSAPPVPTEPNINPSGIESLQSGSYSPEPSAPQDLNSIRIKLKYLNDDLRLVDARLNETLSTFKRRHFSTELSENKRIKLIFNGQLLQREEESLRFYGLFDNCVVHCLIHQSRTAQDNSTESNSRRTGHGRNERDWDLGNLLLVLVSILLSLAWYTRYSYPQLFSFTSTVALLIITGLFAIVSLGMFFPDQNVPNIEVHLR